MQRLYVCVQRLDHTHSRLPKARAQFKHLAVSGAPNEIVTMPTLSPRFGVR